MNPRLTTTLEIIIVVVGSNSAASFNKHDGAHDEDVATVAGVLLSRTCLPPVHVDDQSLRKRRCNLYSR